MVNGTYFGMKIIQYGHPTLLKLICIFQNFFVYFLYINFSFYI